jgi:hypothetical protein
MQTFVVVRRGAWKTHEDVSAARRRAASELERFEEVVRWLRSYEVEEIDGATGSICLFEAVSPEAIRQHSAAAALPVDEILKAADVIVVRPDPAAAAAREGGRA